MACKIRNSSIKRMVAPTAAALSALLFIGSLSACTKADRKPVGPTEKITIAYSASSDSALAQVAQAQGYYRHEGLDAIPQMHPYGKVALQAVLEGRADFATVAETPVMFAIMKGEKIAIVATILTSNRNVAVIARKDKGILTAADLKGRKIAATFGTISEFFMDAFLLVQGISRKDMTVVNLRPDEMGESLAKGNVDAVSAFAPFIINIRKDLGDRGTTFYDDDIYTQTFNLVARQEYISKNPGIVGKMLRALIKAEEFVRQHPEEAQQITADFSRIDIATVRESWVSDNFNVTLDQSLLLALEDESRWAIESGLAGRKKIPNYLEHIYFDGLESVKPKAIRILR